LKPEGNFGFFMVKTQPDFWAIGNLNAGKGQMSPLRIFADYFYGKSAKFANF